MKTLFVTMILGLLCLNAHTQKQVEESISLKKTDEITMKFDFAENIELKTWNKDEVYVKVSVNINDNQDNDKFSIKVERSSNEVRIEEKISDMKSIQGKRVLYDEEGNKVITNCHVSMDLFYEIYLPANANIKLETISGNIEGRSLLGELDLNTISGDIDLSLANNTRANLEFSTISGEMYSDYDFPAKSKKGKYKHHFAKMNFEHELNGGGRDVQLKTISGNIYFRKL